MAKNDSFQSSARNSSRLIPALRCLAPQFPSGEGATVLLKTVDKEYKQCYTGKYERDIPKPE
jgi:hypothetical protein